MAEFLLFPPSSPSKDQATDSAERIRQQCTLRMLMAGSSILPLKSLVAILPASMRSWGKRIKSSSNIPSLKSTVSAPSFTVPAITVVLPMPQKTYLPSMVSPSDVMVRFNGRKEAREGMARVV